MNNGQTTQLPGNGGFEREDLGAKTIFGFLIGLAVLGVLVFFVVTGMYRALIGYYETHRPPVSPLKPATNKPARHADSGSKEGNREDFPAAASGN